MCLFQRSHVIRWEDGRAGDYEQNVAARQKAENRRQRIPFGRLERGHRQSELDETLSLPTARDVYAERSVQGVERQRLEFGTAVELPELRPVNLRNRAQTAIRRHDLYQRGTVERLPDREQNRHCERDGVSADARGSLHNVRGQQRVGRGVRVFAKQTGQRVGRRADGVVSSTVARDVVPRHSRVQARAVLEGRADERLGKGHQDARELCEPKGRVRGRRDRNGRRVWDKSRENQSHRGVTKSVANDRVEVRQIHVVVRLLLGRQQRAAVQPQDDGPRRYRGISQAVDRDGVDKDQPQRDEHQILLRGFGANAYSSEAAQGPAGRLEEHRQPVQRKFVLHDYVGRPRHDARGTVHVGQRIGKGREN